MDTLTKEIIANAIGDVVADVLEYKEIDFSEIVKDKCVVIASEIYEILHKYSPVEEGGSDFDAIEEIVNYAMDKDIPYFAINVPNDTCLDCGFTGEFNDHCPTCGSTNIQQLRRVTGYLTGNYKTAFNAGKIAETEDRVKHTGVSIV